MKNSIIDFINGLRSAVLMERHSLERKNRFLQLLCDALCEIVTHLKIEPVPIPGMQTE